MIKAVIFDLDGVLVTTDAGFIIGRGKNWRSKKNGFYT